MHIFKILVTMKYSGACSPAPTDSPGESSSEGAGTGVGWVGLGILIG